MTLINLERDGDGTMIRTEHGTSRFIGFVPTDVQYVGRKLKLFDSCSQTEYQLKMNCDLRHAVSQIEDVLHTSDKHIEKARGQIEDAGCEDSSSLSDLDVAIMDVYAREWLAEQAKEVDDPFNPFNGGPWTTQGWIKVPAPDMEYLFGDYAGEEA